MHGSVDGIYFVADASRDEVNAPYIFLILITAVKNRVYRVIYIVIKLVIIFPGNASKTEFDKFKMENAADIIIQFGEMGNLAQRAFRFL